MSRKSTVHLAKKAGGSLQKAGAWGVRGGGFYSASMLAVASSRMMTGASFRMARALSTSQKRATRLQKVVLPKPEGPTMA